MRSSTSVRYAMGSTPFSFAVWISVKAMAQWRAPPSLPANNAFLRFNVTGRIARSTVFGVHLHPTVVEEHQQARPMPQRIADGLAPIRGGRDPTGVVLKPDMQGLH